MKDLGAIMRQAQEMQAKMAAAQQKLEASQFEGSAGGGMVKLVLNGTGAMASVRIDPSLLSKDEGEIVEDLIKAAHDDARRKVDEAMKAMASEATAGLGMLPGFKMPF